MVISEGPQPYASTAADPAAYFLGIPTIVRASAATTGGGFGLVEHLALPAGFASPYHTHRHEDDTTGFPDAQITIDDCIVQGETVATRWHLTGTHRGEFLGVAATGRPIAFDGLEYNRVVDGRFVEHRSMFDNVALLRQIGAMG